MADKITVWGRETSANVQKVLWALGELDLAYDRRDVGGKFGQLDTPEYEELNPNRLVPVLQDGELTVWESHAIVRYLAAEYGAGSLWPVDPAARAIVDQWTDWTATTFQPAWIGLFGNLVRTPANRRNPDVVAASIEKSAEAMRIMDRNLAEKPFLAGNELTYADIVAGTALYRWFSMEFERPHLANIDAWHKRLQARPAFVRGTCISYADLVVLPAP